MFSGRLLFALVVLCCCVSSHGKQNQHTSSNTSCGDIHNISFPFRLKTSQSDTCGLEAFELSCENNRTVLDFNPGKYYVQAINYSSQSIRLVDVGIQTNDCSTRPLHSLTYRYSLFGDAYYISQSLNGIPYYTPLYANELVVFVSCENAVKKSPLNIEVPGACENASMSSSDLSQRHYSYVVVGRDVTLSDIGNLCSVNVIAMMTRPISALNKQNISFLDIHNELAHGFELEWYISDIGYKDCIRHAKCFDDAQDLTSNCYKFSLSLAQRILWGIIGALCDLLIP